MTGPKTNERPGIRAQHRHAGMSATKARVVLDLIRGKSVSEARTILQFSERGAAQTIVKVLDSAVANAANNNDIPPEELFVATAYADEGPTMKRWRPRARGRATRIRKRTCHITIIVGRYSAEEWDRIRTRRAESGRATPDASASRARRVAGSRRRSGASEGLPADETVSDETVSDETVSDETAADEVVTDDAAEAPIAEDAADDAADDEAAEAVDDATDEVTEDADADEDADGETEKKDED